MWQWLAGLGPLFEMLENPSDDDRVFDKGDHLDGTAALLAGFDIDLEYAFKALSPGHGAMALLGGFDLVGGLFTAPGRRHLGS